MGRTADDRGASNRTWCAEQRRPLERRDPIPTPFDIATIASEATLHLVLAGELDIATAPLLEAAVEEAGSMGAERIVIDIAAVPFIDSSGLRALIRAVERSAGEGARLSISKPGPQARRLFALSGADDRLPVVE